MGIQLNSDTDFEAEARKGLAKQADDFTKEAREAFGFQGETPDEQRAH